MEKLRVLRSKRGTNLVLHEHLDNLFKTYLGIFTPFVDGGSDIALAMGTKEVTSMDEFTIKSLELEAAIGTLYSEFVPDGKSHDTPPRLRPNDWRLTRRQYCL